MGVSDQGLFKMEHKEGKLKLQKTTLEKFLAIRGIGKREAKKRLEEMEEKDEKNEMAEKK